MAVLRRLIGDALRRERLAQQRTLREVSSAARVSLGYLSEVERGQKEASSELLAAICDALDVPLSRVLREVSDELVLAELGSGGALPVLRRCRSPALRVRASVRRSSSTALPEPSGMPAWLAAWRGGCHSQPRVAAFTGMPNFFRRMFRYSNAYANKKFDEKADPAIQIEQAIDDAKKQHQALTAAGGCRARQPPSARDAPRAAAGGARASSQNSARQSLILCRPGPRRRRSGEGGRVRAGRAGLRRAARRRRSSGRGSEGAARAGLQAVGAGQASRRRQRVSAAPVDGREVQADDPARDRQDAGADERRALDHVRAGTPGRYPDPRRGARARSRRATPRRSDRTSWRAAASRRGCSRCARRPSIRRRQPARRDSRVDVTAASGGTSLAWRRVPLRRHRERRSGAPGVTDRQGQQASVRRHRVRRLRRPPDG